jgi:hypothetical protein
MLVLLLPALLMLVLVLFALLMLALSFVMLVLHRWPGMRIVLVRLVMMLVRRYAADTGEAKRERRCADNCGAKSHRNSLSSREQSNLKIGTNRANARGCGRNSTPRVGRVRGTVQVGARIA